MKRVVILLSLAVFLTVSCEKREIESQVSDVSFTPCQQTKATKSEISDKVNVEFTNQGVQITYHNFAVTCDFTTVDVTHTFVNGVLNITQQGSPNRADCICYSDVSYTIDGISQDDVNVIFINGEQVYCYNEKDAVTQKFYVYSVNRDEQCGYLLFEDRGDPGYYHGSFVWAENLPKEYQEYLLPVTVTFHYTGERCGNYRIINIIRIKKQ